MPWNALADNILSESRRRQELEVEEQSEYQRWRNELYTETRVFVKRVNDLDLSNSEERTRFYELRKDFAESIEQLRSRSETSKAPVEALIEIEELNELLLDTTSRISATVAYLGNDPFKKMKREKEEKEREQRRTDEAVEDKNEIAKKIQSLNSCFDNSLY